MAKQHDDDLFKDTTMTFGEHLDELRVCLFRAVVGLTIASCFGLWVGNYFVQAIEAPLGTALKEYYRTKAETDYIAWSKSETDSGRPVPYTIEEIRKIAAPNEEKSQPELIYDVQMLHVGTLIPDLAPPAPAVVPKTKPEDDTAGQLEATDKKVEPLPPRFNRDNLSAILLWHPLDGDARITSKAFGVTETFSIWLKASLVVGIVLASPWVFLQIWTFVAAGLYPHERKYVYVFLPLSLGLFLSGVALAYLFVFAPVLNWLFSFNQWLGIDPDPRISEWLGFVLLLPLGFGISFQLPLVMLFLNRIGIFDLRAYLEKWRIAILVIFILSAVLTPADPYSMLLMAVPLTILYFGGILLCKLLPKIS